MKSSRWSSEENEFLMHNGHKVPWSTIAAKIGRTEAACKTQYEKIRKLRVIMGTWKGLEV